MSLDLFYKNERKMTTWYCTLEIEDGERENSFHESVIFLSICLHSEIYTMPIENNGGWTNTIPVWKGKNDHWPTIGGGFIGSTFTPVLLTSDHRHQNFCAQKMGNEVILNECSKAGNGVLANTVSYTSIITEQSQSSLASSSSGYSQCCAVWGCSCKPTPLS